MSVPDCLREARSPFHISAWLVLISLVSSEDQISLQLRPPPATPKVASKHDKMIHPDTASITLHILPHLRVPASPPPHHHSPSSPSPAATFRGGATFRTGDGKSKMLNHGCVCEHGASRWDFGCLLSPLSSNQADAPWGTRSRPSSSRALPFTSRSTRGGGGGARRSAALGSCFREAGITTLLVSWCSKTASGASPVFYCSLVSNVCFRSEDPGYRSRISLT